MYFITLKLLYRWIPLCTQYRFQMNFNDFINHYRIEDVKNKLKNGDHQHTTLLGIALESGFNSKATFNRAFKKSTDMTPKDYIEKLP